MLSGSSEGVAAASLVRDALLVRVEATHSAWKQQQRQEWDLQKQDKDGLGWGTAKGGSWGGSGSGSRSGGVGGGGQENGNTSKKSGLKKGAEKKGSRAGPRSSPQHRVTPTASSAGGTGWRRREL